MTSTRLPSPTRKRLLGALALVGLTAALSPALVGCAASCAAQDVHGLNTNCSGGARGYMWTGTSCIYTVACNCTGSDCQRLYATQESCETAHIHCTP